jgi:hypothetical protein
MADDEPQAGTISTAQAARLLMVTEDWVRQLSRNGYIAKAARDRYNLVTAVQGYIRFLKDEERRSSKNAADSRVRDARAAEIERRMAREDRKLIMLDEAMDAYDFATGLYLQSLSGLPARMTRNASERRRLDTICDGERQRLADRFAEGASALRTGEAAFDADEEDDAG